VQIIVGDNIVMPAGRAVLTIPRYLWNETSFTQTLPPWSLDSGSCQQPDFRFLPKIRKSDNH
jgi:hypothetical protein